jgi:nuclear transport factor 2 (NTF2) superfamily protein
MVEIPEIPKKVSLAYSLDSRWRNRSELVIALRPDRIEEFADTCQESPDRQVQ